MFPPAPQALRAQVPRWLLIHGRCMTLSAQVQGTAARWPRGQGRGQGLWEQEDSAFHEFSGPIHFKEIEGISTQVREEGADGAPGQPPGRREDNRTCSVSLIYIRCVLITERTSLGPLPSSGSQGAKQGGRSELSGGCGPVNPHQEDSRTFLKSQCLGVQGRGAR